MLVPARNEADRIAETLRGLRAALVGLALPVRVVVVDDGSTDETGRLAREAGADDVLRLELGRGKGAALNAGLARCEGNLLLLADADLGETASEMAKLLPPVLAGEADMTIAGFPGAGRGGGFGMARRLAQWAIRRGTGCDVSAPLSGQRVVRREVIAAVGGFEEGFGVETALTLDALRLGYRVLVVPTTMRHRALGRTARGFAHRARQLRHIARVVWRKRAWRRLPAQAPPKAP